MGQDISMNHSAYQTPRDEELNNPETQIQWIIPDNFRYSPDQIEELNQYSLRPGAKFQLNANGLPEALDVAPKVNFPEKLLQPLNSLLIIPDDSINLLYNPIDHNYCLSFRYHSKFSFELFCYLDAEIDQSNRYLRVQSSGLGLDRYVCEAGENIVFNSNSFSLSPEILSSLNTPEPDFQQYSLVLLVASLDEHKQAADGVGWQEKDHPAVELYGFQTNYCKKKILAFPKGHHCNKLGDGSDECDDYEFFLDYYAFQYYRDVYTSRLIYQPHRPADDNTRSLSLLSCSPHSTIAEKKEEKDQKEEDWSESGLQLDQIYPQVHSIPQQQRQPGQKEGGEAVLEKAPTEQTTASIFDRFIQFFIPPSSVSPHNKAIPMKETEVAVELSSRKPREDDEEEKSSEVVVSAEEDDGDDEEESKTTRSEDKCVICFTADPEVLLFPCQHSQFCLPCLQRSAAAQITRAAEQLSTRQQLNEQVCPLCRREVTFLLKVSPSSCE